MQPGSSHHALLTRKMLLGVWITFRVASTASKLAQLSNGKTEGIEDNCDPHLASEANLRSKSVLAVLK